VYPKPLTDERRGRGRGSDWNVKNEGMEYLL
jgi:hypothetical protein